MTYPRIALIHALKVSMQPIHSAFATEWPQAELVNIWDDSLPGDRSRDEMLTDEITDRIVALGRYAVMTGADAVLYTCSAFGSAIQQAAEDLPVPVLRPNEAMFQEALLLGDSIGMIVTFEPSVASMTEEFKEECRQLGRQASLKTTLVTAAMTALRNGDADEHNRLVTTAARKLTGCHAVMLAQFSTSQAAAAVRAAIETPVLTAPGAAVSKLKRLLGQA